MSQMFLNVVSTFKGDGIQRATKQLGAFGKQTSSFGSMLGKVGGALAAFGVATKAVQFGRESIVAARDLERNLFALNTVFDDLAPGMNQFAKDAENLGLSQSKAAKASVFIGSVLKQSGFAMNDVAKETKNLVSLGTDLAALYGYDVQEALLGMTALFRGEYDPIEKFGVAMKQRRRTVVSRLRKSSGRFVPPCRSNRSTCRSCGATLTVRSTKVRLLTLPLAASQPLVVTCSTARCRLRLVRSPVRRKTSPPSVRLITST